KMLVN
ncbi:hypothetical protein ACTFIW_003068, partial [Dictyostelium discoideum]